MRSTISHGSIASSAMRSGTTNGADGGRNVIDRGRGAPSGSCGTTTIDGEVARRRRRCVTGIDALDASSIRDASEPRKPMRRRVEHEPEDEPDEQLEHRAGVVGGSATGR